MTRNRGPIAVLWSPFRCGRATHGRPLERRPPHLRSRAERSRAPVRTAGSPGIARCPAPRSSGRVADLDRPGPGRRRLDARRLTIRRRPRADHPRPTGLHPPAPPIQGRRNPPLHNHHHPRRSRRSRDFVHPLMRKSQRFTRMRACHAALNRAGVMTSDTGSDRGFLPADRGDAPGPVSVGAVTHDCRSVPCGAGKLNSADGVRRCAAWNRWCFRRPGCACGLARRRCAGRVLAVRDPAIARWNPVDRPDPDLRVARAWVEDRGD